MARKLSVRAVKTHRVYDIHEAAETLDVHPRTVGRWIRKGVLPAVVDHRPYLIEGRDLKGLPAKLEPGRKQKLRPGEFYCLPCRAARVPAGEMADYRPDGPRHGRLVGLCPVCERWMHRGVARAGLKAVAGNLEVMLASGEPRLSDPAEPVVNVTLE
jgi:excisionase family DNA binding protein